jgi:hypothetical protein
VVERLTRPRARLLGFIVAKRRLVTRSALNRGAELGGEPFAEEPEGAEDDDGSSLDGGCSSLGGGGSATSNSSAPMSTRPVQVFV